MRSWSRSSPASASSSTRISRDVHGFGPHEVVPVGVVVGVDVLVAHRDAAEHVSLEQSLDADLLRHGRRHGVVVGPDRPGRARFAAPNGLDPAAHRPRVGSHTGVLGSPDQQLLFDEVLEERSHDVAREKRGLLLYGGRDEAVELADGHGAACHLEHRPLLAGELPGARGQRCEGEQNQSVSARVHRDAQRVLLGLHLRAAPGAAQRAPDVESLSRSTEDTDARAA